MNSMITLISHIATLTIAISITLLLHGGFKWKIFYRHRYVKFIKTFDSTGKIRFHVGRVLGVEELSGPGQLSIDSCILIV